MSVTNENILLNYPINLIRFNEKKQYAVGLLAYPGKKDPKWSYLFGACMIANQLKKNSWFKNYCDIIVLTPPIEEKHINVLLSKVFDVHAVYEKSLNMNFPFDTNPRWYGVFNKLYFWNKSVFDYKRILILDTDLFIINSNEYVNALTQITGPVAGCYENGFITHNKDIDTKFNNLLPPKYTSYVWSDRKSYYNMINAGVLSLEPDTNIFTTMLKDLNDGWNKLPLKYPSLKGKTNKFIFPEQEYLTGFFSGQWRLLPTPYLSCTTTILHYNHAYSKYWNRFPLDPVYFRSVTLECKNFIEMHKECEIIFKNIVQNIKAASNHYSVSKYVVPLNRLDTTSSQIPSRQIKPSNMRNIIGVTPFSKQTKDIINKQTNEKLKLTKQIQNEKTKIIGKINVKKNIKNDNSNDVITQLNSANTNAFNITPVSKSLK